MTLKILLNKIVKKTEIEKCFVKIMVIHIWKTIRNVYLRFLSYVPLLLGMGKKEIKKLT